MDWLIGLTPLVTGYAAGALCPVGASAGASNPARPPSAAFGIIWPMLYLSLGYAWVSARNASRSARNRNDLAFGVLVALLVLWQVLWGCQSDKRAALYALVSAIAAALAALAFSQKYAPNNAFLLAPLVAWLIFATMLNYTAVQR